ALALPHPHEMPAAAQLLAREREVELARREAAPRIADRLPESAVPDDDGPSAVLAFRDHALETGVFERVVLGLRGHPPLARDQARPLRNRPALQHAVELEPEIPVHVSRGVLLHDELERRARCAQLLRLAARRLRAPAARLWCACEIALALVLAETRGTHSLASSVRLASKCGIPNCADRNVQITAKSNDIAPVRPAAPRDCACKAMALRLHDSVPTPGSRPEAARSTPTTEHPPCARTTERLPLPGLLPAAVDAAASPRRSRARRLETPASRGR